MLEGASCTASFSGTIVELSGMRAISKMACSAPIDEPLHLAVVAVALGREALAGRDELTDAPLLADHAWRAPRRGPPRASRRTSCARYGEPPICCRRPVSRKQAGDRDDVDGPTIAVQSSTHRLVNAAVGVGVEMRRVQNLLHSVERVRIEQDGAEHCRFRVQIARRNTPAGLVWNGPNLFRRAHHASDAPARHQPILTKRAVARNAPR